MSRTQRAALWIGTGLSVAFLWLTDIPLGVPGEWTWNRIRPVAGDELDLVLGLATGGVVLAAYVLIVHRIGFAFETAGRAAQGAWLAFLVVAGFVVLWIVQECPPGLHRMQKAPLVLYTPSTSGYFFHATFRVDSTSAFLSDYRRWVGEGDVLHFGTHPPGLFLFHSAITSLCEASGGLTRAVLATRPDSAKQAFDEVIRAFPLGATRPLTDAEAASLWLAALVTQFLAAATVAPLFLLLRRYGTARTSWEAAALWPLVPAVAIFLPKSDALYPAVGCLLIWCWTEAYRRRSFALAGVAGLLGFSALFVSLAFLPAGVLAVIIGAGETWAASRAESSRAVRKALKSQLPLIALAVVAFVVPLLLFATLADLNLPSVWAQNLRNHAGFYDRYDRTWWKWLAFNPIETAFAVGWPVGMAAAAQLGRRAFRVSAERGAGSAVIGIGAVIGVLWLSGKNSGEAARLWLFLFPWLVWLAGLTMQSRSGQSIPARSTTRNGETAHEQSDGIGLEILAAQAVVCLATVTRVSGFQFG